MNARLLRWWPDAALDVAVAAIAPAWRAWCTDWDLPAPVVRAGNACDSVAPSGRPWHWHEAANPESARVWLGVRHPQGIDAMRQLLFGQDTLLSHRNVEKKATPVASEVAAVGWRELRERLSLTLTGAGMSAVFSEAGSKAAAPCESDWCPWSGAIDVTLDSGRRDAEPVRIHLSGGAAEALCGSRPTSAAGPVSALDPIAAISTAVDRQVVRLAAELDGVTIGLDVFESLRLGDVLPLQHRLDEPLRVRLGHDATDRGLAPLFCAGLLGARRGRRALELVRATASA